MKSSIDNKKDSEEMIKSFVQIADVVLDQGGEASLSGQGTVGV